MDQLSHRIPLQYLRLAHMRSRANRPNEHTLSQISRQMTTWNLKNG
jgi:hypothetical protein